MAIIVEQYPQLRRKEFSPGVSRVATAEVLRKHGSMVGILEVAPNIKFPVHGHTEDQIIFVLEGGIENDRATEALPPGSVLHLGAWNFYNTTVGPKGVKYFGVRPGTPEGGEWDPSDIQHAKPGQAKGRRSAGLSARQIALLPCKAVRGNPALMKRTIVDKTGSPRIELFEALPGNTRAQKANKHQILCVFSGNLKVDGQVCKPWGVVSIPAGTTYTPAGEGGKATYLMVQRT